MTQRPDLSALRERVARLVGEISEIDSRYKGGTESGGNAAILAELARQRLEKTRELQTAQAELARAGEA